MVVTVDTENQVVVSIRDSDKTVQVYALEIDPNVFTTLSATPGNYDRYHDEALSITVQGSNGEGIPNIPVQWEVVTIQTGNGGVNEIGVNEVSINAGATVVAAKGKIFPAVSITDSSGIATATYCPPGNDWVLNDQETITAKVYI